MDTILNNIALLFQYGGLTLYVILLCSVILIAVVIERFVVFARKNGDSREFTETLYKKLKEPEQAMEYCRQHSSAFAAVAMTGLERRDCSKEVLEEAMEASIAGEIYLLEKNLQTMGTLAVVSPFIGLLGTVMGIMQAFADIAAKGTAGTAVVAKGVSEALIATAAGLFVAIPASIFYNYFKNRSRELQTELTLFAAKLSEKIRLPRLMTGQPEDAS